MKRAGRSRRLVRIAALVALVGSAACIVALTTLEGATAHLFLARFYRALGRDEASRIALSRLFNELTVSARHAELLSALEAELRDEQASAWLFDKVSRVLVRFGQPDDAARFVRRWRSFDSGPAPLSRAVEIAEASGRRAEAVALCVAATREQMTDIALALTCADSARGAGRSDLARLWTDAVRERAVTSGERRFGAHIAARDADDALFDARDGDAKAAIVRGLQVIGQFDIATLPLDIRPFVSRLLLAESRFNVGDPARRARRLFLAVNVVEKTPEHRGIAPAFVDGTLSRHRHLYDALLSVVRTEPVADPDLAEWWRQTGLAASSTEVGTLIAQRAATLKHQKPPRSPFNWRLSASDWADRLHNVAMFFFFGVFGSIAFKSERRRAFVAAALSVLCATIVAAALETAQLLWIPTRQPDINDVWTAAAGATIGALSLAVTLWVVALARRQRRGRTR